MRTRQVKDIAYYADGSRAASQPVLFSLEGGGAITSSEHVAAKAVQVATNHLGEFTATLWCNAEGSPATLWACTLPGGEIVRFTLSYGDGQPVTLRSLLPLNLPADAPTTERWSVLKRAAIEYSSYRPLRTYERFTPVAGSRQQLPPEGTFGVASCSYGDEFTLEEIMTAGESAQGWHFSGSVLYLSPAPTADTVIDIVWERVHLPHEVSRTFPTIPLTEWRFVEQLAAAEEADEQQAAVEAGLSSYTIAGTTVKWAQQGGGGPSGASRAARLRAQVISALQEPHAEWG